MADLDPSNLGKRIDSLRQNLLVGVFHHVSRSLFKCDRLTFGMHLVRGLRPNLFGENEWEAFTGLYDAAGAEGSVSVPGAVTNLILFSLLFDPL